MKLWLWTGIEWRHVSDVEAKYRRADGFTIVEAKTAPKEPPKVKAPTQKPDDPPPPPAAPATPAATAAPAPSAPPAADSKPTENK